MKVFISQPMKNKTPEEIKAVRLAAEMMIKAIFPKKKIEMIDSYFEKMRIQHRRLPILASRLSFWQRQT